MIETNIRELRAILSLANSRTKDELKIFEIGRFVEAPELDTSTLNPRTEMFLLSTINLIGKISEIHLERQFGKGPMTQERKEQLCELMETYIIDHRLTDIFAKDSSTESIAKAAVGMTKLYVMNK